MTIKCQEAAEPLPNTGEKLAVPQAGNKALSLKAIAILCHLSPQHNQINMF